MIAAYGHDRGEDRQRDLRRRACADVNPGGHVDQLHELLGDAVPAQLADHARAALAAGNEAHVGDAGLETAP